MPRGTSFRYPFNVVYLESALLDEAGFRHAFFTRRGGVSEGAYSSLNFSYGVGDDEQRVAENFRRAENALRLGSNHVVYLSQVHAADVVDVKGNEPKEQIRTTQGDALTSACPELGLGVRSADCIPVLMADPSTGRATAVHAGWRGLVRGVLPAAVSRTGSHTARLVAAIGPHIEVSAFEVSPDVAGELAACSNAEAPLIETPGQKPHVDLRAIARAQLLSAGLLEEHIDDVRGCTFTQPSLFFSYRRDGKASGRHLSVIVPRKSR